MEKQKTYLCFPKRGGRTFSLSCIATTRLICLFCFSSSSFVISSIIFGKLQIGEEAIVRICYEQICVGRSMKNILPINLFRKLLPLFCFCFFSMQFLVSFSLIQFNPGDLLCFSRSASWYWNRRISHYL